MDNAKTLFVHGIPCEISKPQIESVLTKCHGFISWNEVRLPEPMPGVAVFGFAKFSSVESMIKASQCLDEPELIKSVLPLEDRNKALSIKANDKLRSTVHSALNEWTTFLKEKQLPQGDEESTHTLDLSSETLVRNLRESLKKTSLDSECRVFNLSASEEKKLLAQVKTFREQSLESELTLGRIREDYVKAQLGHSEQASNTSTLPVLEPDSCDLFVANGPSSDLYKQSASHDTGVDSTKYKQALTKRLEWEKEVERDADRRRRNEARADEDRLAVLHDDKELAEHPSRVELLKRYKFYSDPDKWYKDRLKEIGRDKALLAATESEATVEKGATPEVPAPSAKGETVSNLPTSSDTDKLFSWPVKWDNLTESIVERLLSLVSGQVVEYLGVEDEDLINFAVDHIRKHQPALDLVAELEAALDEDAKKLVATVWMELVSSTEPPSSSS